MISGARLWTGGPLQNVYVQGTQIGAVRPTQDDVWGSAFAKNVLEIDGRLVFPGFVNSHAHLDKAMLAGRFANHRGTNDDIRANMKKAKASFTFDDVHDRAGRTLERCVRHGVTA